jgi:hypothetical protein
MRSSRLPAIKTLQQFDFAFQPSIQRDQIESLHELGFIKRRENVIFLGPPGAAKPIWLSPWRSPPQSQDVAFTTVLWSTSSSRSSRPQLRDTRRREWRVRWDQCAGEPQVGAKAEASSSAIEVRGHA